jgi:hypothetical protein
VHSFLEQAGEDNGYEGNIPARLPTKQLVQMHLNFRPFTLQNGVPYRIPRSEISSHAMGAQHAFLTPTYSLDSGLRSFVA